MNETIVSKLDFVNLFLNIMKNVNHELMAWDYLVDNISMLSRKLPKLNLRTIVYTFAKYAIIDSRIKEIRSFATRNRNLLTDLVISDINTFYNENIDWLSEHTDVGPWFSSNAVSFIQLNIKCFILTFNFFSVERRNLSHVHGPH